MCVLAPRSLSCFKINVFFFFLIFFFFCSKKQQQRKISLAQRYLNYCDKVNRKERNNERRNKKKKS